MSLPTGSMKDRNCMITGASNGIGKEVAHQLAAQGATLYLVCRNKERGENALKEIKEKSGNDKLTLLLADLSDQAAVKKLAEDFLATGEPLHVLVNNAGIFNLKFEKSVDGIEKVYATNHLAYFILTEMLLPRIKESAPSRIVNVTSRGHKWAKSIYPLSAAFFDGFEAYGGTKLSNILYTRNLSRKLQGTGVTVNCTHPGDIETGLARNNTGWPSMILGMLKPYFSSVETGAESTVHLAASQDVLHTSGEYFVGTRVKRSSAPSYDLGLGSELRELSLKMTGLSDSAN